MVKARGDVQWTPTERLFHVLLADESVDQSLLRLDGIAETGTIDWQDLAALCAFHRVDTLVSVRLAQLGWSDVPADFLRALNSKSKKLTLRSMQRVSQTLRIMKQLELEGVPCLLLKSDAVGQRFYERPMDRASKDIDLLVHAKDFYRVKEALAPIGFDQTSPPFVPQPQCFDMVEALRAYADFENETGTSAELHWRFFRNPELLKSLYQSFDQDAETIAVGGQKIQVLSRPRQFVYMCCHGVQHAWFRMKWVADIHRILNTLTSEELAEARSIAKHNGVSGVVEDAIALCYSLLEPETVHQNCEARRGNVRRFQRTIKMRREPSKGQVSNLVDVWRNEKNQILIFSGIRYWWASAVIFLAELNDVDRFKLSKKWLGFYVTVGPVRRVVRSAMRYVGQIFGKNSQT